eukprot:5397028-Ditylum_brightwellii.AAC.1
MDSYLLGPVYHNLHRCGTSIQVKATKLQSIEAKPQGWRQSVHHSESAWLSHWIGDCDAVHCGQMHWWTMEQEEWHTWHTSGAAQTWLAFGHWYCCKIGGGGGALLAQWQSLFDSCAVVICVVYVVDVVHVVAQCTHSTHGGQTLSIQRMVFSFFGFGGCKISGIGDIAAADQ